MDTWKKIEDFVAEHAPDVSKSLNTGADSAAIASFERKLAIKLTEDEQKSFSRHDGQDDFGPPLIGDWLLLPLNEISHQHEINLSATSGDGADDQVEPGKGVQKKWYHAGWIPLAFDGAGNFLCMDHAPAEGGVEGQIIHFSSGGGARPVIAKGISEWLAEVADKLEGEAA